MSQVSTTVKLSPSMMCADVFDIGSIVKVFEEGGVEWLHIDIMDGHYVPNLTLGPDYCKMLKKHTNIPMDIHLMVEEADKFIGLFEEFKGSRITFHPETSRHPLATIQSIKKMGLKASIAVDPSIAISQLKYLLPEVDQVCVMTVNPGFAGQKLIQSAMEKLSELKHYREEMQLSYEIEVDGNVSWENIPPMVKEGADVLVLGTSSLFQGDPQVMAENINKIRKLNIENKSQVQKA